MNFADETERRYNENKLRMNTVNRRFNLYLWSHVILGALIFSTSFMAGAVSTTEHHATEKFYFAMSAGVFQILLSIATIVLGWLASSKRRIPSLILLGIYLFSLLMIILGKNGTFSAANIFFLTIGAGLNIAMQFVFNENSDLKQEPGYPLFSLNADRRAHYEAPLYVRKAQASDEMQGIGTPISAPVQPQPQPQPESLFASVPEVKLPPEVRLSKEPDLSEMIGSASQPVQPKVQLQKPDNVSLTGLAPERSGQQQQLPQLSPDAVLADMGAFPSHAATQGDPSLLPSPEEVRARLAAMKQARETHHPESFKG